MISHRCKRLHNSERIFAKIIIGARKVNYKFAEKKPVLDRVSISREITKIIVNFNFLDA
jgi:hypothetical protein